MGFRLLLPLFAAFVAGPGWAAEKPAYLTDPDGVIYLEEQITLPDRSAGNLMNDVRSWLMRDDVRREVRAESASSITFSVSSAVAVPTGILDQAIIGLGGDLAVTGEDDALTLRLTNMRFTQPELDFTKLNDTRYVEYTLEEALPVFEEQHRKVQKDLVRIYEGFEELMDWLVENVPTGSLGAFALGPTDWAPVAEAVPEEPEPILEDDEPARFEQVFACAGPDDEGLRERLRSWDGRWEDLQLAGMIMTGDLRLTRGRYQQKRSNTKFHYFVAVELREAACRVSLIEMKMESGRHNGLYSSFSELYEKSRSRSQRKQKQGKVPVQIFTSVARRTLESFASEVLGAPAG